MELENKIDAKNIGCTVVLSVKLSEDEDPEKFNVFFDENGKVLGTDYPFEPFRSFLIESGKKLKRAVKESMREGISTITVEVVD